MCFFQFTQHYVGGFCFLFALQLISLGCDFSRGSQKQDAAAQADIIFLRDIFIIDIIIYI